MKTIGFIGGGRITRIILQAFTNARIGFDKIAVYDTNPDVLTALKNQFSEIQVYDSMPVKLDYDAVFIALHPPVIMETLGLMRGSTTAKTFFISLAPKINIEKLSGQINPAKIIRMIPNATSYMNSGFNPVCFSSEFNKDEKQIVFEFLSVFGKTFEVEESKLESYAILSAMLPTYFWFQWQQLEEIGLKMGLSEQESKEAIQETLEAAISLFYHSGLSTSEVLDLIPVKPMAAHEETIRNCYSNALLPLYEKIKP